MATRRRKVTGIGAVDVTAPLPANAALILSMTSRISAGRRRVIIHQNRKRQHRPVVAHGVSRERADVGQATGFGVNLTCNLYRPESKAQRTVDSPDRQQCDPLFAQRRVGHIFSRVAMACGVTML